MSDLVTGITTALDIVKKLRDLNKKVGEAEFKMLLADLTSELGDAKLAAANLKIELAELKTRNATLAEKASRASSEEPVVDQGAYVFGDPTRHYCTACYDTKGLKVMVKEMEAAFRDFGRWMCPSCSASM